MSDGPSSNMKAALILAEHKYLGKIITPALNIERDSINWERLGYHGQSGGTQAALSWMYCLFCDALPPEDWNYRDPFDAFFAMDREIQVLVFKAMAARHGFVDIVLTDKPKSAFQQMIEDAAKEAAE